MEKVAISTSQALISGALNSLSYRLTNCQPCHFSNYQMVIGKGEDQIRTQDSVDKTIKFLQNWVTDTSNPSHSELLKKINFYNDFSNLRYITILDENPNLKTAHDAFTIPIMYSAIIKYKIQEKHPCMFWNQFFSWIHEFKDCETPIEDRSFETIWQKYYLLHIADSSTSIRFDGTMRNSSFKDGTGRTYSAIDDYFLKYLTVNQTNNKCDTLSFQSIADETKVSRRIYIDYKSKLPKIVKKEFLDSTSRKMKPCIISSDNKVIKEGSGYEKVAKEIILMEDKSLDSYAFTSDAENKIVSDMQLKACETFGGEIYPLTSIINILAQLCVNDPMLLESYGNTLYSINCSNVDKVAPTSRDEIEIIKEYGCSLSIIETLKSALSDTI